MKLVLVGLGVCAVGMGAFAELPDGVVAIENECLRYAISPDGLNAVFVDKAAGTDYCDRTGKTPCAFVKRAGQVLGATSARYHGGQLDLEFAEAAVHAKLLVKVLPRYFTVEVVSVTGGEVEEFGFIDIPLTLKGSLEDPFAGCALALNLQTNVPEVPGPNKRLHAMCYPKFGLVGAKVAIVGAPMAALRDVMKEVLLAADDLPHSNIGGPFALDAEIARGSYLFDFGQITESTVDAWVAFVKSLGLNQVDFHTGGSLRFGDCAPNPKLFPNGRASVKAVIDKLHAGGISAGLHTYAFFMAKDTPYVTPVPDPRLGKDATFSLAEDLTADATAVRVLESTEKMSTTTGFFVRNSVTLQIDDELITYAGFAKEAPFAFTGCARGAYGTHAAPHATGAKVHHLKECFGLFTPDADSTLLSEVAANAASTFNECGFDMMYLDALDGEDILGGGEWAWHYGSKFVFEIARRLDKPALFEMSTFHHHLWCVRARMGAWDHPTRSHKRFVDLHVAANREGAGMFLPMNLGWWAVQTWNDAASSLQREPTFPDDIEYLMGKCLGNDMGISLMGVNPDNIGAVPAYQRLAPIFRQYEELRHAHYFPESIKAKLRVPGDEYTLDQAPGGAWRFRPVRYERHKVLGMDGWSNTWTATNRFRAQPLEMRIEALVSARPYDAPEVAVIEDFGAPEAYADHAGQLGVAASVETLPKPEKGWAGQSDFPFGGFTGTSDRAEARGAWAKAARTFSPVLNIAEKQALGVWVYGDGQGELLNIQLLSPVYTASTGMGDHYVNVDFTGWRYFELVELEGGHIVDYDWPYSGGAYAVYRESVDFSKIETLALWYNNVPPGRKVACGLSPIKALPLAAATITNPKITIGGKALTFPVEMASGSYLEFRSVDDCTLYGPKGEVLSKVVPVGDVPELSEGDSAVAFDCATKEGLTPRACITLITRGETLAE